MTFELNEEEREFLVAILDGVYREKFHELHHTDTADFKTLVKVEIGLLETLREKLAVA